MRLSLVTLVWRIAAAAWNKNPAKNRGKVCVCALSSVIYSFPLKMITSIMCLQPLLTGKVSLIHVHVTCARHWGHQERGRRQKNLPCLRFQVGVCVYMLVKKKICHWMCVYVSSTELCLVRLELWLPEVPVHFLAPGLLGFHVHIHRPGHCLTPSCTAWQKGEELGLGGGPPAVVGGRMSSATLK